MLLNQQDVIEAKNSRIVEIGNQLTEIEKRKMKSEV